MREGVLHFANDLAESLAYGDAAYCAFLDRVDNYVEQQGMKIAPLPGIYFLGLPWLAKMNSSFLSGVGDDTARLADCIRRPGE